MISKGVENCRPCRRKASSGSSKAIPTGLDQLLNLKKEKEEKKRKEEKKKKQKERNLEIREVRRSGRS